VYPKGTELHWDYTPTDFFEAPYSHVSPVYDLRIQDGSAVAVLHVAQDPVDANLSTEIESRVASLFLVRQLQTHRQYSLGGKCVHQHSDGQHFVVVPDGIDIGISFDIGRIDSQVVDADGNVVWDSREERIASESALLELVAPKLMGSPELRAMFESYTTAVDDPSNEFVHLYEVRDALVAHFGSELAARKGLEIGKKEWQRIGILADVEPVEVGRHRGRHAPALRAPTPEELDEARAIIGRWILAFARAL
jgi:hypothetical protein